MLAVASVALMMTSGPVSANDFYWDVDGSLSLPVNNDVDGNGLGGPGTWDTTTINWWDGSGMFVWPNNNTANAIFTYAFPTTPYAIPTAFNVTVDAGGITANKLSFLRSGYTITGSTLTLAGTTPTLQANLGESATIASQILGSDGLTKTGGGSIRLSNTSNSYTGTTTIANGTLIITNQSALGASLDAIVVTAFNPYIGANFLGVNNLRGFGGGSLMLDGTGGNTTISRDLSLQGRGPVGDNGAALISTGVNTLSGTVDMGVAFSGTNLNTRIIAADGTLNITGPLNVLGIAATTISSLGGINQAGASFYNVTGVIAGTGTLESSGGGTLFLNPSDSSGFSGTFRVSASAASGQSVVRIDSAGVLGSRTSGTTGAVLDLNGGTLAVLMDTPDVKVSNGTNANVYFRAASFIFADHTPGSSVRDQTVAFGNMSYEDGIVLTFNSRNGYGMSFTTAPVNGGNGNTTMANNLQGGAQLTFTGNFWSNADNTGNRVMTFSGNGNTTINGSIIAASAAFDHSLTKSGTGTLTLTGTLSTLDGDINVQNGTVAINDRRAITNNSSNISLGFNSGTTNTAGTLSIIGNNATQTDLTFSKVINLAGTTGGGTILANQTGTSPGVIFSSDFTATGAGAKTLTLGGTNIGANTIDGAIVNSTSNTALSKIDAGRWVLGGTNLYTGSTTISNGTLQLKSNAAASTILADTSAIVFNQVNQYAGGTLELIGQASTNNVETLGALTPANGSGTIKLTPGSGGTASIVFASLGAVGGGGTVNISTPTASDTVKFTSITGITAGNIANAGVYYNGSDFALVPAANTAVRAPIYGTDADFTTGATLTAGANNQLTGNFATGGVLAIDSLKISGGNTLTLGGNLTIRTVAAATASGGIIQTGGSGTITGAFSVGTNNAAALVVNVDGGANSLTLESTIIGTGGFTKVGAGTLRLDAANNQTGTISINEGTVRLTGSGRLGAASAALTIRQDGILELNGITPATTTGAFNNNGIVRNTSATTDVVFTVGGGNGTGTSNGIIEDGGLANISLVKIGTGAQSWLGLSTYTGTTTIDSTGIVSINNLQNGGMASGIGASSNAAGNLIFTGASATQAYGGLNYTGTTNDETDRLFTFGGTAANSGARIQSNGVNGATSSWTNTGALAFGTVDIDQGLVLGGASTGDNRFSPIINDNGTGVVSVYKADAGVWYLEATNTYTGPTTILGGALYVNTGTSLPTASNLVLNGGSIARTGAFTRTLGTGANQVQFGANAAGGFSAGGAPLTVDWGTGAVWGTGPFLGTGALLLNNSGVAKSDVDIISGFEITQGAASAFNATTTAASATVTLTSGTTAGWAIGQEITGNTNIPAGRTIATITSPTTFTLNSGTGVLAGAGVGTSSLAGGYRQVNVGDFTSIGADFGTISGAITGAGSLAKEGAGILNLRGANTYTGQTLLRAGTLVVETLGLSTAPGATSVGDSTLGNTNAGAILIGNGLTGAGILEYVGLGETSDRYIRLNTTTGLVQLHADGTGPLILTNVANDLVAGAKTLFLRGVNAGGNMITSQLSNNGGNLAVAVDGSATWILTNGANDYSGTTSVNGGALGIGHDNALGDGTGTLSISNGSVFAYGGDRTIINPITQSASSGTIAAFIGEYSLTLTGLWTDPSTTSTTRFIRNNIVSGKTLILSGNYSATAGTTSLGIGFDGSGDTIVNGIISSTMPSFGVIYAGTGSLTLGGANTYTGKTRITSGTLRLGDNEVIPNAAVNPANNEVVIDPGLGLTATLDLNGKTETINGLTANTAGTAIIDNTSATAASLTFGANDQAVNIGGVGTYTITDSGSGPLSITKTGTGIASILTGVTLTYQGSTNVNGGSMTIASAVNGTTGLSVTNGGSTLALTGGITTPSAMTSVVVGNGATLSLLDGAGSQFSMLTNLQLGSSGGTMTTLNLNVGDIANPDMLATDTFTLLTGGTLSLFAGNQITFNLTDAGLDGNSTYNLIDVTGGGLTLGALGVGDWILGATPGGFSSVTLNKTDTLISITTGNLITGTSYWRGLLGGGTDTTWNANANNWSVDIGPGNTGEGKAGTNAAASTPGSGTDVVFQWNAPTNAAVVTTLEQNFKINSLTFEDATVVADTATSATINPGTLATSRLEIAPQVVTDGIKVLTTNATNATISGSVKLGGVATGQTWEVTNAGSILSLGSLFGERDVTKTGAGKVTLTAAADPTFNSGTTADFNINAGTLEILDSSALGNTINANLASVALNSTGAFYYNNATSGTIANSLTMNGGTLSAGRAAGGAAVTHTYSGAVNVSGNSFINLRNINSATPATVANNMTLSGVVSGSSSLTVSSDETVANLVGGNAEVGTLTINNAASSWTGDLILNSGSVDITAAASATVLPGDITFDKFGRLIVRGVNGQTINRPDTLTFTAGTIGEYLLDNTSAVLAADFVINQNGQVNLGSGGTGASARFTISDAATQLNIVGNVVLGGNSSISEDGGDADSFLTISGIISDGGSGYSLAINDDAGGWGISNDIIRLTGPNTFTGNVILASGTLQFNTVTNIGGAASSLGQGNAIDVTGSSILSFIGSSAQSTDRTITSTAGVITLSANGAAAADTITYSGAITVGPITDGSQIVLTGTAGREGIITGGITQTGDAADMTVNGGTWTHQTGTSRIGDGLTVTGADTIFNLNSGLFQVRNDVFVIADSNLNLNGTGVLSFSVATLSADASLRAYTGGSITLGANDAVVVTDFDGLRIGVDGTGIGTLNMGTFNQTVLEFILGNRNLDRTGIVNGTGTLTVTGNLDLYAGTIHANLASTGATVFEKIGADTVTLRGNNSGLASTGATIVYDGILALDFTVDNNTKLRAASTLDLRGARLNVIGNNTAATTQTVGGLTLANGGSSTIQVTGGTLQDAVLNLGAITRGNNAQDGTIRFILPSGTQSATNGITTTSPNSTFGMLGTGAAATSDAAYATVEDGTGTWFATASGGNVVALASIAKNDVTTWLSGDHITDETTGFTGILQSANINSLRFNAAGGSDVVMPQGGVLIIGSGGFLITSNVGGTPSITGGTLASGATELVITQDSLQTFEIGSDIRINHAVTKTGTGTLRLSGDNVYTGVTEIQEGTLQATGNSIGDTSVVSLSASRQTTFELLADETIGRLQGGQRATDGEYGTVAVGSHTLTINHSGSSTTYSGVLTGDGTIIKQGTHNWGLNNVSAGFTGVFIVESGAVIVSNTGQINADIIRINRGAALDLTNTGTTRSGTRILDTTGITLNSADGTFQGETIVRGLSIRTDQDTTLDETVGLLTLNTGASYVGMQAGTVSDDSDIIVQNIARLNSSTLNVRGTNLGNTNNGAIAHNNLRIGDATNETAFIAALVGGGGAKGTQNVSIVPWAIGQDTNNFLGTNAAVVLAVTHMGNSLMTYDAGVGFRPLNFATEYDTIAGSAATDNARQSLTADLTGLVGTTVNSLVLHNESAAAATHAVTGTGAGQTLAITSGAMLFTLNPAAAAGNYGITIGGFDSGITVGATNEYVIHVVNPDAGAPTKSLTATISSRLTSAADITKSGRGTLILTGLNTAGGGAKKTTINEGILEIADLDNIGGNTGSLVFAGGILRLGAGMTDDISLRTISLLDGGGTIDTNGVDLALANSVGSGLGGLTKVGLGNLTLNAAAAYTGATTITGGTLTIGANNAIGNGGALNIGAGATLALGTKNITAGLVTTSGASPAITGTGTITASTGFFFSNTGDLTVDAILAGPGGLFKNQTNILTLTGLSTYTGTTEIQAGTISFDTIANVGGGASALGAPVTVENGIIRTGLTSTSTTLTYTGAGSTSDRIIEMQGTTGGLTINSDGTGALNLGTIQTANNGIKTLTLSGAATGFDNSVALIDECVNTLNVIKTGAGTWELTGANTYTGTTSAGGGTLRAGNSLAFGAVSVVTLINTDSVLELADGVDIANALTVSNTGNNKVLRLQSGATLGEYSGAIAIAETTAGNFDVDADTGGTFTLSGIISGAVAGGLEKTGNGTVVLTADNTYNGATTVTAGTLQLGDGTGTGSLNIASTISVDSGATFSVNQNDTVTQGADFSNAPITGAGSFTQAGSGTTVLNQANTYSGGTNINAGVLQVDGAGALGTAGTIDFGGGTLQYTANNTEDYSARIGDSTSAIRIDTNGQTVTYATALANTNTGGLTKTGEGTLELTAGNLYTGNTVIDNGTFLANNVSGSSTGGSTNITVSGDAVLGGTGTVGTALATTTIGDGATLTGGTVGTVGNLSFTGDLTMEANSIWLVDLVNQSGSSDLINVSGALSLAGTIVINDFMNTFDNDGSFYTIADYGTRSGFFTGYADDSEIIIGGGVWKINYGGDGTTAGSITLTAVPEPGTFGLLGLALAGLFFRRIRKRRADVAVARAAGE